MKNYSKIFKLVMLVLLVISVALVIWGSIVGFESNGAKATDVLFYWTYAMIAIAAVVVILFGAFISFKNNPKSLIKLLIGLVAVVALCLVVYLISPGKPAMGMLEQPSAATLRLTDTVLNLTYLAGGLAILAIIVGEIVMSVRNKK